MSEPVVPTHANEILIKKRLNIRALQFFLGLGLTLAMSLTVALSLTLLGSIFAYGLPFAGVLGILFLSVVVAKFFAIPLGLGALFGWLVNFITNPSWFDKPFGWKAMSVYSVTALGCIAGITLFGMASNYLLPLVASALVIPLNIFIPLLLVSLAVSIVTYCIISYMVINWSYPNGKAPLNSKEDSSHQKMYLKNDAMKGCEKDLRPGSEAYKTPDLDEDVVTVGEGLPKGVEDKKCPANEPMADDDVSLENGSRPGV